MKTKILALTLFALTALAVFFYPATPLPTSEHNQPAHIEAVFVLDTTGSMGGLIQAAKDKIWSIASTMASAQPAPVIKLGLVAYRDRGDQYVTRVVDLSEDLDSTYATLMDFEAAGGGDGPESVNQALFEAVNNISWSQDKNSYKTVFLVGDAPPHMDYQDDVKYPQIIELAKQKGIVINTIQCGEMTDTIHPWQQIAQLGHGQYFQVAQAGSAIALATPYDMKIARLSKELDGTRLYYGTVEEKEKKRAKIEATGKLHAESSVAAQARRGVFNTSGSGGKNLLGDNELVDDIQHNRVDLTSIPREHLPAPMAALKPGEREAYVRENIKKREELTGQIRALAEQRQQYLSKKVEEMGTGGESLDEQIYSAVRDQAADKGLKYEADAAKY